MPRDINGNYTLPEPAVVPGTTIESAWANTTCDDIAAALTDSLSRSGAGGMLSSFRFSDGSKPAPGIAWTNQPTVGFYRAAFNDMRLAIANTDIQQWTLSSVGINAALQVNASVYMPNTGSLYFQDNVATPNAALSPNSSNELILGLGASWVRLYGFIGGIVKWYSEAALFHIGTQFSVTGAATFGSTVNFADSIDIANGIYAIGNNRSIYFRAADTNPYAVLGVNALNEITLGSAFSMIHFTIQNVECARINPSGGFKAKTFAGGAYAAADAIHEFSVSNIGNYCLAVGNIGAATPYGIDIAFHVVGAGARGYGNYYIDGRDTDGAVFAMASNGGLLNYSANNVNLSDARAKRDIAAGYDYTGFVERLDYKRFKYAGMPGGEVIGLIAQEVERYAPELVVDKALNGMKGIREQQVQQRINSVIPSLIARIRALEGVVHP